MIKPKPTQLELKEATVVKDVSIHATGVASILFNDECKSVPNRAMLLTQVNEGVTESYSGDYYESSAHVGSGHTCIPSYGTQVLVAVLQGNNYILGKLSNATLGPLPTAMSPKGFRGEYSYIRTDGFGYAWGHVLNDNRSVDVGEDGDMKIPAPMGHLTRVSERNIELIGSKFWPFLGLSYLHPTASRKFMGKEEVLLAGKEGDEERKYDNLFVKNNQDVWEGPGDDVKRFTYDELGDKSFLGVPDIGRVVSNNTVVDSMNESMRLHQEGAKQHWLYDGRTVDVSMGALELYGKNWKGFALDHYKENVGDTKLMPLGVIPTLGDTDTLTYSKDEFSKVTLFDSGARDVIDASSNRLAVSRSTSLIATTNAKLCDVNGIYPTAIGHHVKANGMEQTTADEATVIIAGTDGINSTEVKVTPAGITIIQKDAVENARIEIGAGGAITIISGPQGFSKVEMTGTTIDVGKNPTVQSQIGGLGVASAPIGLDDKVSLINAQFSLVWMAPPQGVGNMSAPVPVTVPGTVLLTSILPTPIKSIEALTRNSKVA